MKWVKIRHGYWQLEISALVVLDLLLCDDMWDGYLCVGGKELLLFCEKESIEDAKAEMFKLFGTIERSLRSALLSV